MINYMQIENFKSLKKISLPLQNLNLFFGMNGMGKSSLPFPASNGGVLPLGE